MKTRNVYFRKPILRINLNAPQAVEAPAPAPVELEAPPVEAPTDQAAGWDPNAPATWDPDPWPDAPEPGSDFDIEDEARDMGAEVRCRRVAMGWTVLELSRRVGCTVGALHRFEDGDHADGWAEIWKGASALLVAA